MVLSDDYIQCREKSLIGSVRMHHYRGLLPIPFVRFPFIKVLLGAPLNAWNGPGAKALPNDISPNTMGLAGSGRPVRCGCLGTISIKSESLIQKTFRDRNLVLVSVSRLTASVQLRKGDGTATDIGLRSWRQSEPIWFGVAVRRVQAVSGKDSVSKATEG